MKQEQRTYQCQAAGRPVKLTRQTFYVSGIGDDVPTRNTPARIATPMPARYSGVTADESVMTATKGRPDGRPFVASGLGQSIAGSAAKLTVAWPVLWVMRSA